MSSILIILWIFEGILYHPNILLSHHVLWACRILVIPSLLICLLISCRNISQQMASAIWQSQQLSICRHCGWFHQSIHVSHEISSISQRQSIRQWSREGKTPTKDCLMFRPTLQKLWVLNNAMANLPRTTKFCTHVLHIEGEELFGSQTWHAAWRQTRITQAKLSQICPQVETRSSRARVAGCFLTNIQEECSSNPQVMDATPLV
jgi:hypothetical protein